MKQALQHNKRCCDPPPLVKGSWALLNSADWRGQHTGGTDKLKERFEGPYRVTKISNNGLNVALQLPTNDKRHPVFHVSKVKPFLGDIDDAATEATTEVSSSQ